MNSFKKHPTLFIGLGVTLLFLCIGLIRVAFLDTLELAFYDVFMKMRGDAEAAADIVLVDIDDDSIEKLGRWPWPRSLLAAAIDQINAGSPKVIGLNIILSEPEQSAGLDELNQLKRLFAEQVLPASGSNGQMFFEAMTAAQTRLDNDNRLSEAIQAADNIILPVYLKASSIVPEDATVTDNLLIDHALQNIRSSPEGGNYPRSNDITLPIPRFLESARGIGHINLIFDFDGTTRRERPVYEYRNIYIPSYTLRLAAAYLQVPNSKIRVHLDEAVYLGSRKIPLTASSDILVSFKGPAGSFKRIAFVDVINEKIPPTIFKNKLVLISPSAAGIMNPLSTPTDATMPVGEFSAHALWGILTANSIVEPSWNFGLEMGLILIIGLLITFVFPRLKAMFASLALVVLVMLLVGGSGYFFIANGAWIRVVYPLTMLIVGYISVISITYFVTESKKEKVEGESAESNRMLGLSFQSQGMLDMAFDKFRRVPVDDEMKDILYNLALDYERKRQINKAAMVYDYIEKHDKKFKDVSAKKHKLMQASETMVFGDPLLGGAASSDDLLATGSDTRPTLGRYEIIKQLGKGAMGTVYLGKDPRINRTTAIKTFRFSDEFEPEQVTELKAKFFREAESAGTLSHPNIVTIYDAGDEHDLAYIAMELLEGETLEKYIKKGHLLPMLKVIDYAADIADALDYAHQKGIVHRDIKPANIMYIKSGVVKITDFGIARITATSQTQTGIVKGTPYYMSPEQISGKKVDGRSDIFSLGTMMFQLLTGELPFRGENPAALMHQIMHVVHPDPKSINPKIVTPVVKVIDKALAKSRAERYQKAAHLRDHLREVRRKIDEIIATKKNTPGPA